MFNAFISYSHSEDSDLSAKLQLALERFAKPWYKLRNLNIFRDESNLEATPHLWSNIQKALDTSEYFLLLASPASASSVWVEKEIEYWLESHSLETIIIVLTEGDVSWDNSNHNISNPKMNALPEVLESKISEAPFYIDLRESKEQDELDLKYPLFRRHILKLAAQLHGLAPKDLAGEELRQHRKMIRTRNAAIGLLIVLFLSSAVAAFFAYQKQIEAEENFELAEKRLKSAQANFLIAEAQLENNPTKAIEIAIQAYNTNNDSVILDRAYRIFRDKQIYQRLQTPDTFNMPLVVQFIPGSTEFITRHPLQNREIQGGLSLSDNTDITALSAETIGERFVRRRLDGSTVSEYDRSYEEEFRSQQDALFENVTYDINFDGEAFMLYDISSNTLAGEYEFSIKGSTYKAGFVTPDNKKAVSIWNDGSIRLLDIATGFITTYETGGLPKIDAEMRRGTDTYLSYESLLSISSDGMHMIVAATDGLQYWDLENKALLGSLQTNGPISCARFSEDNTSIEYSVGNQNSRLWKFQSDGSISELNSQCNLDPHFRNLRDIRLAGEWNEILVEKNTDSTMPVLKANESIEQFVALKDTDQILTISSDTLRLYAYPSYKSETGEFLPPTQKIPKWDSKDEFRDIRFNSNKSRFLLSMMDYDGFNLTYELWDNRTGTSICTFPEIFAMDANNPIIDFSPDGKKILITYGEMLTVWDCPITLDELPIFNSVNVEE